MKLGIRSKLFLTSLALMLGVGLICGLYLESQLREQLEQRIETELSRQARSVREALLAAPHIRSMAELDATADRLGRALDSRVTLIAPDGRVIGDSNLDLAGVAAVENHGDRPEVRAALARDAGQARRFSTTLDTEMLYVAVPWPDPAGPGPPGVARVARPLSEIDRAVAQLRRLLAVVGLVGLVAAVILSALAWHFTSRTLRELIDSAQVLASSPAGARERPPTDLDASDEIGGLAGSLNRMAEDIESTVATMAAERARFEAVVEGMNEALVALDRDRRVTLMNHTALELFGLTEAPIGEPFIEYLRVPAIQEALAICDEPRSCEFQMPGLEVTRRILARVSPEPERGGCILVMHDVTSIRRLETMRRDFVANVSHELRTPVSVIRANVETLLDGAVEQPVHRTRLLDGLSRNAERLSRLLDDLLDLARLEAGREIVASDAVAVKDAALAARESIDPAARDKRIALRCDIDPSLHVQGDDHALDQILINYLDNAVKYTPAGGEVTITARARDTRILIEVCDDGPGIAPHLRERVFERFYRVDPGRSRDMGGTGLGLSIVKHLAEAMGGDAGVTERQPRGSRFWVSLPRA